MIPRERSKSVVGGRLVGLVPTLGEGGSCSKSCVRTLSPRTGVNHIHPCGWRMTSPVIPALPWLPDASMGASMQLR